MQACVVSVTLMVFRNNSTIYYCEKKNVVFPERGPTMYVKTG